MSADYPGVERPVAHALLREFEIPDHGGEVSTLRRDHRLGIACDHAVSLERVEILISKECRLANSLRVQKPESPLKWRAGGAGLFKQVGVCPVTHSLRISLGPLELGQDVWRADVGIVDGIARRIACTPLGKIQRKAGKRRSRDLLANVAHVSDDCIRRRGEFRITLSFLIEEAAFDAVR